ncbi:olfactory receptor 56A4-like [Ambystoma mexicanum]|uniref:olfactory receptor 56A4-like n=1 Tax=Ambystoma mexicanum TaxID=8296 RepID=UPI0037E8DCB1
MLPLNSTSSNRIPHFLLICFPSMQSWQYWISIPVALLFLVAMFANITILAVIQREQHLHKPMFYYLGILAFLDVFLCITTMPKILAILCFNLTSITLPLCFLQMYLMNTLLSMQSSAFLFMAYDRYVAICNPLRYPSIVTSRFVAKTLGFLLLRNGLLCLPYPILAAKLQYCSRNVVEHCVCTNVAVTSLACSDSRINKIYQLVIGFGLLGSDLIFICMSYCMILRVVKIQVEGVAAKAFSTCTPHLILISFFYTILLVWIFTIKMEKVVRPDITILLNVLHLLIPPTLNPIVYGVRAKDIRRGITNVLRDGSKMIKLK